MREGMERLATTSTVALVEHQHEGAPIVDSMVTRCRWCRRRAEGSDPIIR